MSRDKKIELPCKIGDTVYVFLFDEIIKCEVNTIVIDENNDVYVKFGKCDNGVCPAKIYSWEFEIAGYVAEALNDITGGSYGKIMENRMY